MEQGSGRTDFCSLFYNAHAEVRISFLTLLQAWKALLSELILRA